MPFFKPGKLEWGNQRKRIKTFLKYACSVQSCASLYSGLQIHGIFSKMEQNEIFLDLNFTSD